MFPSFKNTFYHLLYKDAKNTVQFSSVTQSCLTLCDPMDCSLQASLFITNSWCLLKLMSMLLVAKVVQKYINCI